MDYDTIVEILPSAIEIAVILNSGNMIKNFPIAFLLEFDYISDHLEISETKISNEFTYYPNFVY